jgi:hypothetical protein
LRAEYPAWGLFIALRALTPVRITAKEFTAGQNTFTFGQVDAALAAPDHIL